jgi:hypothetical protein
VICQSEYYSGEARQPFVHVGSICFHDAMF